MKKQEIVDKVLKHRYGDKYKEARQFLPDGTQYMEQAIDLTRDALRRELLNDIQSKGKVKMENAVMTKTVNHQLELERERIINIVKTRCEGNKK